MSWKKSEFHNSCYGDFAEAYDSYKVNSFALSRFKTVFLQRDFSLVFINSLIHYCLQHLLLHLIKFNKLHLKFELIHNIYHLSPLKAAINQFTSCATIDEEISIRFTLENMSRRTQIKRTISPALNRIIHQLCDTRVRDLSAFNLITMRNFSRT